jgi:hypothetical protein
MGTLTGRLKREHATLECMAENYCAHHHVRHQDGLCPACDHLMGYARKRLEKCPYGSKKPACSNCTIHCYKKLQREQVRAIMRFSGPRMALRHPWRSLLHFYDRFRPAPHPMELRRSRKNQTGSAN